MIEVRSSRAAVRALVSGDSEFLQTLGEFVDIRTLWNDRLDKHGRERRTSARYLGSRSHFLFSYSSGFS
jgi:hypothetical protein